MFFHLSLPFTKLLKQCKIEVYSKERREFTMEKWVCEPCGYVYDPEVGDPDSGVEPGTAFEDLPEDWVCPVCGATKDMFSKE